MLIEMRRYAVLPGRMDDMNARMSGMLLPLFAEHGIPRPRAIWTNDEQTSTMTWIVEWPDFETRQAGWTSFFPIFVAARKAEGTPEFVTRTTLTLVTPWPDAMIGFDAAGTCESLWHVQPRIGFAAGFAAACDAVAFDRFRDAGASGVHAASLVFGELPAATVLLSWPDTAARARGLAMIAADDLSPGLSEAVLGDGNTFGARGEWETLDRTPYL